MDFSLNKTPINIIKDSGIVNEVIRGNFTSIKRIKRIKCIKRIKSIKSQQAIFFLLDAFMGIVIFFLLDVIMRIVIFFLLDILCP